MKKTRSSILIQWTQCLAHLLDGTQEMTRACLKEKMISKMKRLNFMAKIKMKMKTSMSKKYSKAQLYLLIFRKNLSKSLKMKKLVMR